MRQELGRLPFRRPEQRGDQRHQLGGLERLAEKVVGAERRRVPCDIERSGACRAGRRGRRAPGASSGPDRKSTRLNSSHGYISYAVFCLKKKKTSTRGTTGNVRLEVRGPEWAGTNVAGRNDD